MRCMCVIISFISIYMNNPSYASSWHDCRKRNMNTFIPRQWFWKSTKLVGRATFQFYAFSMYVCMYVCTTHTYIYINRKIILINNFIMKMFSWEFVWVSDIKERHLFVDTRIRVCLYFDLFNKEVKVFVGLNFF